MPKLRAIPDDDDRGERSADLAREYVRILRRRRDYLLDVGYERRRQGLRAELEFGEAAALEWALGIIARAVPREVAE